MEHVHASGNGSMVTEFLIARFLVHFLRVSAQPHSVIHRLGIIFKWCALIFMRMTSAAAELTMPCELHSLPHKNKLNFYSLHLLLSAYSMISTFYSEMHTNKAPLHASTSYVHIFAQKREFFPCAAAVVHFAYMANCNRMQSCASQS